MEKRPVQIIALSYYSRKDVQKAVFDFCKNRETIANFNNKFFAKRPDVFDYQNDLFMQAKNGATSFHCSEEVWENPLDIRTEMTPEQYNEIRIGWDFLIDIDSKYLDYSKLAAKLIVQALEYHGVKNVGIKFSGSKGFHIIVPWKSFPNELNGVQTKDMFPEWPRAIANYVSNMIHDKLTDEIISLQKVSEENKLYEMIYIPTKEKAIVRTVSLYKCMNCKTEVENMKAKRKTLRCNLCNYDMKRISKEEFFVAPSSQDNSKKSPELFEKRATVKSVIDTVDIILVAPRHLFRAPYSLHEKTALASIVIDKDDIENFQPQDANPLKVQVKNFMPDVREGEASELLRVALDSVKREELPKKKFSGKSIDIKGLKITDDIFPDEIKNILKGIKGDGRKRALSILLAFFSSLEMPREYIESKIEEWNGKNYSLLKTGYVKSQIDWFIKNPRMPQNYDKPIYRELGVQGATSSQVKNPINYTIREAMRKKGRHK